MGAGTVVRNIITERVKAKTAALNCDYAKSTLLLKALCQMAVPQARKPGNECMVFSFPLSSVYHLKIFIITQPA